MYKWYNNKWELKTEDFWHILTYQLENDDFGGVLSRAEKNILDQTLKNKTDLGQFCHGFESLLKNIIPSSRYEHVEIVKSSFYEIWYKWDL